MVRNKLHWDANDAVGLSKQRTGKSSFVLEVPLRHLRPSVIYSVPCDWILQRAYCSVIEKGSFRIRRTLEAWHTSATKHADNNSKPIPNQYSILFKQ